VGDAVGTRGADLDDARTDDQPVALVPDARQPGVERDIDARALCPADDRERQPGRGSKRIAQQLGQRADGILRRDPRLRGQREGTFSHDGLRGDRHDGWIGGSHRGHRTERAAVPRSRPRQNTSLTRYISR
jgi:hypothetical protein